MVRKGWQSMDVPSGWIQVLRGPRPKSVQWPLADKSAFALSLLVKRLKFSIKQDVVWAPLLLFFHLRRVVIADVCGKPQCVSTSPVGIGKARYKVTSFGSGPCLIDKIQLPSFHL